MEHLLTREFLWKLCSEGVIHLTSVRCDIIIDPYFERRTPLLRTELSTANAVLGSATQRGSELDSLSLLHDGVKSSFLLYALPSLEGNSCTSDRFGHTTPPMIAVNWERFEKAPDGTLRPRLSLVEQANPTNAAIAIDVTSQVSTTRIVDKYWHDLQAAIAREDEERRHQDAKSMAIWDEIREDMIQKGEFDDEEIDDTVET